MTRFYLVVSALLSSAPVTAQSLSGYVVTTGGDTLRGNVREHSDGSLRLSGAGQTRTYTAAQLRGYGLGHGPVTRSRPVQLADGSADFLFVVPIVEGPISLYTRANDRGLLLRHRNDTLLELTASNWHLAFNRYLHDCPALDPAGREQLTLPFSTDNLKKLVTRYNQCVQPDWKPRKLARASVWQRYHGAYGGVVAARHTPGKTPLPEPGYAGTGYQAGLEWSWRRASGLQTSTQLDYTHIVASSTVYDDYFGTSPQPLELRQRLHLGLLAATVGVGQHLTLGRNIGLWASGGAGLTTGITGQTHIQERRKGSTGAFSTTRTTREVELPFGFVHTEGRAGLSLPLSARADLRLNAVYRYYLLTNTHLAGAQLTYCWGKK